MYRAWSRLRTPILWEEYVAARSAALVVYDTTKEAWNREAHARLLRTPCSHDWWLKMKESLFGPSSSMPALRSPTGGLVTDPAEKASLLGVHFDGKQCRDEFSAPASCFPEPSCTSLAFRSGLVKKLLLDLDSYGGADPTGIFPLFLKMVANVLAPKLAQLFRLLLRRGCFPESWRVANVSAIPKGPPSPDKENYRPISITAILSKVYERLVSHKLLRFCEERQLIPATQFAYRKGLGCADALLSVSHHLQGALEVGGEARLVQLDFSAAFDRVSHAGLLFRLESLGVGGKILSVCR